MPTDFAPGENFVITHYCCGHTAITCKSDGTGWDGPSGENQMETQSLENYH